MSAPEDRERYIEGLRVLAAALEQHPEIPLPYEGRWGDINWFLHGDDQREMAATIARALPCTLGKRVWGKEDEHFELNGVLGGGLKVAINADREAVCTRRVTGTEEREVEETVTPAVTRKVVKRVDVVEWDCGPVLGSALAKPEPGGDAA